MGWNNLCIQQIGSLDVQKLALQASGANAVALGGMSMFPMMAGMGNGIALENPTKVVALTEVISLS